MRVKIIKHCCVPYNGHDFVQADGPFELPEGIAQILINGGTCEEVGSPQEDEQEDEQENEHDDDNGDNDNEERELLSLPVVVRRDLIDVLEDAGYTTAEELLAADVDDLVALHGIGEKTAEMLYSEAQAFINKE